MQASEIARLRASTRLSQARFGALIGVTAATVSMWESGITSPRPNRESALRQAVRAHLAMIARLIKILRDNEDCANRKIWVKDQ